MKLSKAWIVATNDFEIFRRKKYTLYSLIGLPAVLSVGLPIVIWLTLMKGSALTGVDVRQFMLFEAPRARTHMETLAGWCADGRLSPAVGRVFAWSEFGEALTFALTGQGLGKTVLGVDDG